MQDNNPFSQNPTDVPSPGGFPMPPNNLPAVEPPAPEPPKAPAQKPRVTIDGVSLDYGDNEPLPAPEPVAVPEQPVTSVAPGNGNNAFQTPVMPAQPVPAEPIGFAQVPLTPAPETAPAELPISQPTIEPAPVNEIPFENDPSVEPPLFSQPTDDSEYIDQLANSAEPTSEATPDFGAVPSLSDDYSPDDIVINSPLQPKKFNWLTTILIAVAILGIGASIFLFVQYRSMSGQLQNAQYQMEQYQIEAENGLKASSQLESLQNTVREQSEKIDDLKKENDELKNVGDDLKKVEAERDKLKKDLTTRERQMSNCLNDKTCRKFFNN